MPSRSQPLANVTEPLEYDVLLGDVSGTNSHYGNVLWRALVEANLRAFERQSAHQKSATAKSIVLAIRQQDPPGRFLQQDYFTGLWYDVGDIEARRRTSQALKGFATDILVSLRKEMLRGPSRGVKAHSTEVRPSPKPIATPSDEDSLDAMYQIAATRGRKQKDSLIDIFAQAMGSDYHHLDLTSDPVALDRSDPSRSTDLLSENGTSTQMSYSARKLQGNELDDIDERISVMFRSVMSMGSTLSIGTFEIDGSVCSSDAAMPCACNRLHKKPSIGFLRTEPSTMSLLSMTSSD